MNAEFQTNFEIIRCYDEKSLPPPVTKVGILPFVPGPEHRILLMKPHAEAKHLGAPAFQIAKGTRRIFINDRWCDMRDEDLQYADECFYEPVITTALREGQEEIGLKSINIKRLYDMGGFVFISTSRKVKKPLHMFAALIDKPDDFIDYEATTAETRWMTASEFSQLGREDHVAIVQEIMVRLQDKIWRII